MCPGRVITGIKAIPSLAPSHATQIRGTRGAWSGAFQAQVPQSGRSVRQTTVGPREATADVGL